MNLNSVNGNGAAINVIGSPKDDAIIYILENNLFQNNSAIEGGAVYI